MGKSAKGTRISGQFGTHHSLKNARYVGGRKGGQGMADSKKKKLAKAAEAVAKARSHQESRMQSGDA